MTAIRLALRLGRWGLVGFSGVAFIATFINAAGFYAIAGHTQAEREAFARSFAQIASQLTVLLPPATRLDTVGGYVQYRAYGSLAIVFAIWALTSASGAARGDEERGIVEMVLATGLSRARATAARIVAFAFACFIAALAASLGFILGVISGNETFSIAPSIEAAVLLAALAMSCYSLVLLISQLLAPRFAMGLAGAVLLGLFLLNSLSRTFDSLATLRWLSPFRYYELSQPVSPGGTFDVQATLVLIGIAVVAGATATLAFTLRDLGAALFALRTAAGPPTYEGSSALIWRIPVIRGLYDRRVGLTLWAVGVSAIGILFVILTKTIVQPLLAIPGLAQYFAVFVHGAIYPSFLSYIWFGFAQLLLAGFAITQVARWSAEDTDGRLELILGNPVSRTQVLIERATVLAVGALIIAVAFPLLAPPAIAHQSHVGLDDFAIYRGEPLTTAAHVAFGAETSEEVDAFFEAALEAGATARGEPGVWVQYSDRYYAAFVNDLHGNNVEAVRHAPQTIAEAPTRCGVP